jgi:hypothetical protein
MRDKRERFSMSNSYSENTGRTSHVRDCQMWAEIDYLDSPTDYREYLPGQGTSFAMSDRDELMMLDAENHSSRKPTTRLSLVAVAVITLLIFLLICGCFLHLFLDAF